MGLCGLFRFTELMPTESLKGRKAHERQCSPEGLNQWCGGKGHSATAAKCGKWCHCGKAPGNQWRPASSYQWCGGKGHSTTAAKCGKRCRCGKGHERQSSPGGLYQWCGRKGQSTTAAKLGKRCRCGKGHERQSSPEGLYQWCGRKGYSTTAAKCGKRCRCGGKGRKGQDGDREEVALWDKGWGTKMNRSHGGETGRADNQPIGAGACGSVRF